MPWLFKIYQGVKTTATSTTTTTTTTFEYRGTYLLSATRAQFERMVTSALADIRETMGVRYRPPIAFTLRGRTNTRGELSLAGITRLSSRDGITIELKIQAPAAVSLRRFAPIIVHELFHTVVPIVSGSLLWSEGVTDFCAHWFLGLLDDLPRKRAHVNAVRHTDPAYYRFKRPYTEGACAMLELFRAHPRVTMAALRDVVREATRSRDAFFADHGREDVVAHDSRFAAFFERGRGRGRGRGDTDRPEWNTETPTHP